MSIRTIPERDDPDLQTKKFLGIDMSTPCLKTSLMNGIGSGKMQFLSPLVTILSAALRNTFLNKIEDYNQGVVTN